MSNPIKPSIKSEWLSLLFIVSGFVMAFYFYANFPAQVATHWNIRGEVDGYSSSFIGAFMLPILSLFMYLVFLFLPYFDPKREQYANFPEIYHWIKDIILGFLLVLFLMTGFNGLGYRVDVGFWVPIMIGILFIVLGLLMRKISPNWFIGIRTPWTMSSEDVWKKTHAASVWVFAAAGLLMMATSLVEPTIKIILFIISISLLVFVLPIYSYFLLNQEKKKEK